MKHLEELKIGATAILFCLIMLFVYAVFPKDGFVPSTKAPMPLVPSSDNWEEEDNYGFQIYTQESNYDSQDSYSDYQEPSSSEENTPPQTDSEETLPPTETTEPEDPSVPDDSDPQEPSEDDSIAEEPSQDDSFVEEPSEDTSYEDSSSEDEFDWEETEETYPPES